MKTTKRALFSSVIALVLCFAMLLGTTYAWFTDTVTSGRNIIQSGNLDVVLEYKTKWSDDWTTVDETTKIFDENALYEPGYTEVVYLRISNAGSLALRCSLSLNVLNETVATSILGNEIKLSEYLEIGTYIQDEYASGANYANILMPVMFGTKAAALNTVMLEKFADANKTLVDNCVLEAGDETAQVMAIVLNMPENVGNEANAAKDSVPASIEFGVNLLATQASAESDSFGPEYDKEAWTDVTEVPTPDANGVVNVYTANQLAGVMTNTTGIKEINIIEDIDLAGRTWTPAFVSAPDLVINGNGHTISNMTTYGASNVGFIGAAYQNITIKDLTFKNIKVEATGSFVGGIIGNAWDHADITLDNVDVVDSAVSTTIPNKAIRIGGLIGYSPFTRGDLVLKNCDVTNSTFSGYHNVGAMVGTLMFYGPEQGTITIENCTAKNNTLKYGSPNVGAFAFGASTSGYTEYVPATGFTAENNEVIAVAHYFNETTKTTLRDFIEKGVTKIELSEDVTVDKWIMFSETKSISNGKIITVNPLNLTIYGNGHTLTVNSVESATNGDLLFDDASYLNISNLTINMNCAGGGISLENGVLENVIFNYKSTCVYPGTGDITIKNCEFNTAAHSIYYESARDNLKIVDNTFNVADTANVVILRGKEIFTGNTVNSGRTVNIVSNTATVSNNVFNCRVKLYKEGQVLSNNVFTKDAYVDIENGITSVNVSGNYWGGSAPSATQIPTAIAGNVVVNNYYTTYTDGVLGGLNN